MYPTQARIKPKLMSKGLNKSEANILFVCYVK